MQTHRKQHTIASPVGVDGFGYWSGRDVHVRICPARAGSGIVFVRHDVDPPVRIRAAIENRIETPRRTTIASDGVTVEMVEHILAALAGLQIDNCEVWVDQPEMPGCDGSARPFVEALEAAGLVELPAVRARLILRDVMRLGDDESWIEARPGTQDGLTLQVQLDFGNHCAIGRQSLQLAITTESFRSQLAPSRTFMLQEDGYRLLAQGLGRRVTPRDLLVFGPDGLIDNQLRFHDECVRHKVLDLVGDLALSGCDVHGHIVAHRSGHRLNAELVRALLAEGEVLLAGRRSA